MNILDDFNYEVLAIEIDTSLSALRVVRALDQLKQTRGLPKYICVDNGPELISKLSKEWAQTQGVELLFIQPGKPTQNAYIERFNGSYRYEILNAYEFPHLSEIREIRQNWMQEYNHERPHASLGYLSPNQMFQLNNVKDNLNCILKRYKSYSTF